jgi:hypothetical protein
MRPFWSRTRIETDSLSAKEPIALIAGDP